MIVFGFGNALPATKALAKVIDGQPSAACFHEMNPSCMRYEGTMQVLLDACAGFRGIIAGGPRDALVLDQTREDAVAAFGRLQVMEQTPSLLGDVAHYHLRYVAELARADPDIRFIWAEMPKASAKSAWLWKARVRRWTARKIADYLYDLMLRQPHYLTQNYWTDHDRSRWKPDAVWDKCFPSFDCDSIEACVERFLDDYADRATSLMDSLPSDRFLRVSAAGLYDGCDQGRVLDFLAIPQAERAPVNLRGIFEARFVLGGGE